MDDSIRGVIEQYSRNACAGTMSLGALVRALVLAGIESCHSDYRLTLTICYMPDDETCMLEMPIPDVVISETFDRSAVRSAILGMQSGLVKCPEFMALTMTACWHALLAQYSTLADTATVLRGEIRFYALRERGRKHLT